MKPRQLIIFILCAVTLSTACTANGSEPGDGHAAAGLTAAADSADAAPEPASGDTLTVAMTGDIMMGTTYPRNALPADSGRGLFADVKDILRRADVAAGNLEGTLCDTSFARDTRKSEKSYFFRTPPEMAVRLKEAGFDYLCMANNHTKDFGSAGIRATEKTLDRIGIKYSGISGHDELAIVERGGIRYGFCSFGHNSYTLKHNDLAKVKSVLDSLNRSADVTVVSFHGGGEGKAFSHLPYGKEEYANEDRGDLRRFAHFCIDNGADIVFGHGPHVVRCVEMYKDRFIAYSLGNFCTPYSVSIVGTAGYAPVIEAMIDRSGRFIGGRIYSFIQHRGIGPRKDTACTVARYIRSLTAADIRDGQLKISDDGRIYPAYR